MVDVLDHVGGFDGLVLDLCGQVGQRIDYGLDEVDQLVDELDQTDHLDLADVEVDRVLELFVVDGCVGVCLVGVQRWLIM